MDNCDLPAHVFLLQVHLGIDWVNHCALVYFLGGLRLLSFLFIFLDQILSRDALDLVGVVSVFIFINWHNDVVLESSLGLFWLLRLLLNDQITPCIMTFLEYLVDLFSGLDVLELGLTGLAIVEVLHIGEVAVNGLVLVEDIFAGSRHVVKSCPASISFRRQFVQIDKIVILVGRVQIFSVRRLHERQGSIPSRAGVIFSRFFWARPFSPRGASCDLQDIDLGNVTVGGFLDLEIELFHHLGVQVDCVTSLSLGGAPGCNDFLGCGGGGRTLHCAELI